MRAGWFLGGALALLSPFAALAIDAPHDASSLGEGGAGVDCKSCHLGHNAPGASLTSKAGNFNLCQSCHALGTSTGFGFPWSASMQAVPGATGSSHRWDASTSSGGATPPPAGSVLDQRSPGGQLQCSTCHDPHNNGTARGRQHTSIPVGVARTPTSGGTGRTLTLAQPGAAAASRGYRIRACGPSSFQLSHDRGISWRSFTAGAWVDGALGVDCKSSTADGGSPLLDDPAVRVTFAGTLVADDLWDFYVSYPFLRVENTASAMCLTCHPDRNMSHARVSGDDAGYPADGMNVFSHPVGVGLGANGMGYDRAAPLDATGDVQSTSSDASDPGGASNNLELAAAGEVHCLTCHHPHNADSNSLSADPR